MSGPLALITVDLRSRRMSTTCGRKSFRHLEELHKHHTRDKNGQYVNTFSEEFWSSRAVAELQPCCLEAEQRITRWVEAAVSSVYATFDEHMRRFAKQSHCLYTPMLPMMDIVKATMTAVPSTTSSMAPQI
ncbi:hypothetical protein M9H77_04386 [Catharanthus roseus]|uniref:Uncharacterized protein n=1 Tax=Catharanthus roseus TaxID=4058 RepID=A0ACC0CEI2_CATRO|nr:hypothetical protein M9H77_04386 [Catharanthus roseus]